jgi:hypothetical protein
MLMRQTNRQAPKLIGVREQRNNGRSAWSCLANVRNGSKADIIESLVPDCSYASSRGSSLLTRHAKDSASR